MDKKIGQARMAQHIVYYSCKAGQKALTNPSKKNSEGTEALLKHFQNYNKPEIDLLEYVEKLVFNSG